jgi:hypothetical protein
LTAVTLIIGIVIGLSKTSGRPFKHLIPICQECACVENIYFLNIQFLFRRGWIRLDHFQNNISIYPDNLENIFADANEIL